MRSNTRVLVLVAIIAQFSVSLALVCGSGTCGNVGDECCNDAKLGSVCYAPANYDCVGGTTLCGEGLGACGSVCYDKTNYFCCNGVLAQNGQTCASTPTPTPTAAANNCPAAANQPGVNCAEADLCCGAGSMSPTCLPADGSKKCCEWYLSSIECDNNQTCGGDLGSGASSTALCGAPGTTFCNAGLGINAFCTAGQTCCTLDESAFCCDAGSTCGTSVGVCNAPTAAPTTTPTHAAANNCPAAANQPGVNCADASLCCGSGTMTPSCLPADGSKKCCEWYLSSIECDNNQTCGGDLGSGASSNALCGAPGTTFCNAGLGINAFCTAGQTCCTLYESAFCCDAGTTCGTSVGVCNAPTAAPTAAPTTTPTPAPAVNNCPAAVSQPGVNCSAGTTCCGADTMSPSCLPADGSKKCCVWYLASTQCDADQVCGGELGPGASSTALCGAAGTTFCNAGDGTNTFCSASQKCCTYGSTAFCCAENQTCGNGSCNSA